MDIVDSGVYVAHFASLEKQRVKLLKLHSLGFGEPGVLLCLVEMAFRSFGGFGVILLDVLGGQQRPTNEVSSFNRFESRGFNGVTTGSMHPLDSLFSGWEVIYAVGLLQGMACLVPFWMVYKVASDLCVGLAECGSGHGCHVSR